MLTLLTIAGGVALLLFSMRYLRKGLDRIFGPRLGAWMQQLGRTTPRSFVAGLGAGIMAPSSTTISVLAVNAVQSGHLKSRQMLVVMLGANIALTLTVQLIALRVETIAPVLIFFGVLLFQTTRRSALRGVGQVILAFGFLYLAIGIVKTAVADAELGQAEDFRQLVELASSYPWLLAVLAAVLAMVLQSSTATIALLIGLTGSGLVGLPEATAVVAGANVGLAGTTLAIGWARLESRRLGLANLALKLVVAVALLLLLQLPGRLLPDPAPASLPFVIAQLHTGFNIAVAVIGLLVSRPLTEQLERWLPEGAAAARAGGPKFISSAPIGSVALALGQSLREILHISEIVKSMLLDAWDAMERDDEQLARSVGERDDEVDQLEASVKRFLTRVVQEESPEHHAGEQMLQLRYLSELETVGDIIDKNLVELVRKKIRLRAHFSTQGSAELEDFYRQVVENFAIADTVFQSRDRALARQLLRHKERLNQLETELRDRHFARLNEGMPESLETSAIHLDVLTHLKRINSSLSHVAYDVVRDGEP